MSKIVIENANHYYAALKLIELLFLEGHIPDYILRNALAEAEDEVDVTQFKIYRE